MARARGARQEVFVTIGSVKYGFRASARSSPYRTVLGHVVVTDANRGGVIFGANSPKPNRASKEISGSVVSSFCDPSQESTLAGSSQNGGWAISRTSRRRGITNTPKARTVFVNMPGGWRYAWNITRAELDLADDLGFTVAVGTESGLVFGAQSPKPPRATRKANGQITSTFIEPDQTIMDAAIADGWSISNTFGVVLDVP